MPMTNGQENAIEQLRNIESTSDYTLSVEYVNEPEDGDTNLNVGISINCGGYQQKKGGLKYREREPFEVVVGSNFPFQKPSVFTRHTRFSNFPHVQWKCHLCLYVAPDIQWDPQDGMYGFIKRLDLWLEKAAKNELDPEGIPLHPPVTYTNVGETSSVVIKENTPEINQGEWVGLAQIKKINERRFDLIDWIDMDATDEYPDYVGLAILLDDKLPFEFPSKIDQLFDLLNKHGVPTRRLLLLIQIAVANNEKGEPLILLIGTPMRGISGGELKQHLMAWYIYPEASKAFRLTINKYSEDEERVEIGEEAEKILMDEWVKECGVNWCRVLEQRSEVTKRRDLKSPMSVFKDLNVEIWGCGALGANVALSLARADVNSIKLVDYGIVKPGLLVRQPFYDSEIGLPKVAALKNKIGEISPSIDVKVDYSNILNSVLVDGQIDSEADVIIDCSASNSVRYKMELCRKNMSESIPHIFSMMIDSEAKMAALASAPPENSGGPSDIYRKTLMEASKYRKYSDLKDSFFSNKGEADLFQPEPGCSSPTFMASATDVSALSNNLLNIIAEDIRSDKEDGKSYFITQPHCSIYNSYKNLDVEVFSFSKDLIQVDPINEFEIRYSKNALRDVKGFINKHKRDRNPESETGGILWGEIDKNLKIIWVEQASGPPPDSKFSPHQFVCGTEGVSEMNESKKSSSSDTIGYLGIWHTHPESEALPSTKDYDAVYELLNESELPSQKVFISIVGTLDSQPTVGSYVFGQDNFVEIITEYE